jgi:hypothetical protein
MTTTQSKPTSHGVLKFTEPEPEPPVWIPKALRDILVIEVGGMTPAEEQDKYGVWHMKALKTCHLYGKIIEIGDDFFVPGNTALNLAHGRDAEFIDDDGRKKKEEDLARVARELGAPINYQTAPQFNSFPDEKPIKRKHVLS